MIQVKAAWSKVVRRFTVEDGIQLEDLKKRIVETFPELERATLNSILLYYRDSDGDTISLSSDHELQTAIGLVENNTLKLIIQVHITEDEPESDNDEEDQFLIFGFPSLFDNTSLFNRPSLCGHSSYDSNPLLSLLSFDRPTWRERRELLHRQEERLRRRREYEEKMRKAHLEHLKELRAKLEEEQKKAQEEWQKRKADDADKVVQKETSDELNSMLPSFPPGWTVNPFGSYTPTVQSKHGSTMYVWGPWGYTAYYRGDKDEEDVKTEDKGDKTSGEDKRDKTSAETAKDINSTKTEA